MNANLATIILTSVVVSSIISSLIGGIFLFLSERSKRISDEKRTKLDIACRLTELHDKKVTELLKVSPGKVLWRNHLTTFKSYYDYLNDIWKINKLVKKDFDSPIPDK